MDVGGNLELGSLLSSGRLHRRLEGEMFSISLVELVNSHLLEVLSKADTAAGGHLSLLNCLPIYCYYLVFE
jgi:hypothetical protein